MFVGDYYLSLEPDLAFTKLSATAAPTLPFASVNRRNRFAHEMQRETVSSAAPLQDPQ